MKEERNEIETLVLVTPQLVEAMEPHEVPECGPGMRTTSPSDCELYLKGFLEVPNPCPPCNNGACQQHNGGAAPGGPESAPAPNASGAPQPGPSAYFQRQTSPLAVRPAMATNSYQGGKKDGATPNKSAGDLPGFGGPVGYDAGN